ncbi:MAG: SRPBCC family protein [Coriobacteriia bacterium]|nr:SRPBCC family protein [Coriobacteriia bacterium]
MRARASAYIDREPHAVFERLADFASHASWRPEVLSTQVIGEVARGSEVIQGVSLQGRTAALELVITEFDPPERISFRTKTANPRARGGFRLEREGSGTRVNISATIELEGAASLAEERIRGAAELNARESLARLKAQLESGR